MLLHLTQFRKTSKIPSVCRPDSIGHPNSTGGKGNLSDAANEH